MKKFTNILKRIFIASALALTLASCSDFEDEKSGKSYITFAISNARTINPTFRTENFSDFVLTGSHNGESVQTVGSWSSLSNVKAEIMAGIWNFTLTCKNGSAILTGTLEDFEIVEGNNSLSFELSPVSNGSRNDYGQIEISVSVPEEVKCVTAGLFDVESEEELSEFKTENLEITESKVTYKKTAVAVGSYIVKFFMYADSEKSVLVNEYTEVVNVASMATSTAEKTIENVNETYSITYELGSGKVKDGVSYSEKYSILTTVRLLGADDVECEDHVFVGWYETEDFSDDRVVSITAGSQIGNKTYYAKWAILANLTLEATAIAERLNNIESTDAGAYTITATGNCTSSTLSDIASALKNNKDITLSLDLHGVTGLTSISASIFADCTNLTSVIFPVTVTSMESGVFKGCTSLTSITIPFVGSSGTATSASSNTLFGYIFGTTSYTGGTKTVQNYASSSSSTYYIPESLTKVTVLGGKLLYGAFYGCSDLTEINLAAGISSIGEKAFYNCSSLQTFQIPQSAASLGNSAFYGCANLTEIAIPSSVTTIGTYCFQNCTNISSVDFTSATALTTIGGSAFSGCKKIESIDLSKATKLTKIESAAFSGCSAITEMKIPFVGNTSTATSASSSTLFGYIFGNNTSTGTSISQQYSSSKTTYNIPSGLKKVTVTEKHPLAGAFSGCAMIEEIVLPSGLSSIPDYLFYNCSSLKAYEIPATATKIGAYSFSGCKSFTQITIPTSITTIGNYAFSECPKISEIAIPSSVTTIGTNCFQNCTNLASVDFTNATALTTIGGSAFSGCSKITKIDLSGATALTKIDTYAFSNCSSITSVDLSTATALTTIGNYAFSGCSAITEMKIPFVGNSKTATSASSSTLFGYIFGSNTSTGTSISQQYSSSKTTYNIPSGLKKVTVTEKHPLAGAFSGCAMIEEIVLPSGLSSIPDYLFYNCSSLKAYEIPATATKIGAYSFSGCTSFTQITIPTTVISIGQYSFQNCTALDLVIPATVTTIASYAFQTMKSVHYKNHTTTTLYGAKELKKDISIINLSDDCGNISYDEQCKICENITHIEGLAHLFNADGVCSKCGASVSVTSNGSYKFTADDYLCTWTSNNKSKSSTKATTTWTVKGISEIVWTVSSEASYDKLTITVDGTTEVKEKSSIDSGTITIDSATEHTVVATYLKDGSGDKNSDCATLIFK